MLVNYHKQSTASMPETESQYYPKPSSRPLSIASRIWIAWDLVNPPVWTTIAVEGHGLIDAQKLRNAIKIASQANPGSQLVLRGNLAWSRWVDSGTSPLLTEIENSDWDGMSSDGLKSLLKTHDVYRGPTAEVLIFYGDPLRMIFRAHHAVMDGRGLITWIEDIFRALNGQEPIGSDYTMVENDLLHLPDKTIYQPAYCNFISPVGRPIGNDNERIWKRFRVKGPHSKLLAKIMFLTAKAARQQEEGPVRFGIPVDLRSRRPGMRSTGNLTNAVYIQVDRESTIEQIADEIQRRLREKDDGKLNLEDLLIPYVPISIMRRILAADEQRNFSRNRYRCTGFISNLGKVDLSRFSTRSFQAASFFLFPVSIVSLPFFLTMSGYHDMIDYVLSMPKSFAAGGKIEEIIDYIVSGLNGVIPYQV